MNPLKTSLASAFALMLVGPLLAQKAKVSVTAGPQPAKIYRSDRGQCLSFDFMVKNEGDVPLDVESLRMSIFDGKGALVTSRALDSNGMVRSVATLPSTEIPGGKTVVEFNPWQELPLNLEIKTLRYVFVFSPKGSDTQTKVEVSLNPVVGEQKTELSLPVKGKVIIRDGYDLYAHHRRVDLQHPFILQLGMAHNPTRFGMDFMEVDAQDSTHQEKGQKNEDYYIFGKPVMAPAAGTVIDCIDGRADNPIGQFGVNYEELMRTKNGRMLGGNYIILDHGHGEYSFLAHLKKDSVKVKKGDRVAAGQLLGQVGNSGDSGEPHLHYQLQRSPGFDSETILPLFRNFRRHLGSQTVNVPLGELNTGDLVEAL